MANKTTALTDAEMAKVTGGAFQQGTAGAENLLGTSTADVIFAGGGNDTVSAGAGADQIYGESGNDTVHAGGGDDLVYGGEGNDSLNGGSGADQLQGEGGNDVMDGGAGDGAADLAFGGAGNDSFVWAPGDGNDQFQGGEGTDTLNVVGMSLETLQGALTVEGQGLQIKVTNNVVTFTDAAGNPATFTGAINHNGETMRFSGIEAIRLG